MIVTIKNINFFTSPTLSDFIGIIYDTDRCIYWKHFYICIIPETNYRQSFTASMSRGDKQKVTLFATFSTSAEIYSFFKLLII